VSPTARSSLEAHRSFLGASSLEVLAVFALAASRGCASEMHGFHLRSVAVSLPGARNPRQPACCRRPVWGSTGQVHEDRYGAERMKAWGITIRSLHWLLVAAFFAPFLIDDDGLVLHEGFGYVAMGLVLLRVVYGILGPEEAALRSLVFPPTEIARYLIGLVRLRVKKYPLHTPAGGLMVMVLLPAILLTGASGAALELGGEAFEGLHGAAAGFTVFLVAVHALGTTVSALAHRQVPFLSMITGERRDLPR